MFLQILPSFLRAIICVFLLTIASPLFATPPSTTQIDQVIEAAKEKEVIATIRATLEAHLYKEMETMAQKENFSAAQKDDLLRLLSRLSAGLVKSYLGSRWNHSFVNLMSAILMLMNCKPC